MVIKGTSEQLYDMIIDFHDAVFEKDINKFNFDITMLPTVDMGLFSDFVTLINDIVSDFKDRNIEVDFNIND